MFITTCSGHIVLLETSHKTQGKIITKKERIETLKGFTGHSYSSPVRIYIPTRGYVSRLGLITLLVLKSSRTQRK